jgi:hypothetical protein
MASRASCQPDKNRALQLATFAAERADHAIEQSEDAISKRTNAIWFAAQQGASLRELEAATGLGRERIRRLLRSLDR